MADGAVIGGHVGFGCTMRTTGQVLLALLPDEQFGRLPDATTAFDEGAIAPTQTP